MVPGHSETPQGERTLALSYSFCNSSSRKPSQTASLLCSQSLVPRSSKATVIWPWGLIMPLGTGDTSSVPGTGSVQEALSGYQMGEWAQIRTLWGHFPERFYDCSVPRFPYLCSGNNSCSAPRVKVQSEHPIWCLVTLTSEGLRAGFLSCPISLLRPQLVCKARISHLESTWPVSASGHCAGLRCD